jgi:hypothetical protein
MLCCDVGILCIKSCGDVLSHQAPLALDRPHLALLLLPLLLAALVRGRQQRRLEVGPQVVCVVLARHGEQAPLEGGRVGHPGYQTVCGGGGWHVRGDGSRMEAHSAGNKRVREESSDAGIG